MIPIPGRSMAMTKPLRFGRSRQPSESTDSVRVSAIEFSWLSKAFSNRTFDEPVAILMNRNRNSPGLWPRSFLRSYKGCVDFPKLLTNSLDSKASRNSGSGLIDPIRVELSRQLDFRDRPARDVQEFRTKFRADRPVFPVEICGLLFEYATALPHERLRS